MSGVITTVTPKKIAPQGKPLFEQDLVDEQDRDVHQCGLLDEDAQGQRDARRIPRPSGASQVKHESKSDKRRGKDVRTGRDVVDGFRNGRVQQERPGEYRSDS